MVVYLKTVSFEMEHTLNICKNKSKYKEKMFKHHLKTCFYCTFVINFKKKNYQKAFLYLPIINLLTKLLRYVINSNKNCS